VSSSRNFGRNGISSRHSRRNSINDVERNILDDDRHEVATIINFNSTNYLPTRDSLVFFDPVSGMKKVEYRCADVFTHQPTWFNESDADANAKIIYCPKSSCAKKIGIYSS
jgi:hypothetical protein